MTYEQLQEFTKVARGEKKADLVIKNSTVIDVYNHKLLSQDIAICKDTIVGLGSYKGEEEIDARGKFALPGFIDSHIHIESSYSSPEYLGQMLIPNGTTTIIADPHEIVNVCGLKGLEYMINASKQTPLDIRFMMPSCVPATPFENSGATIKAQDMDLEDENIQGLGEFMDYVGVITANKDSIDKILKAKKAGKIIDGHIPGILGQDLNAYISCGIKTDHECSEKVEMLEKISKGMYVLLRQGSTCHDLENLIEAVNELNSRRCLLCSDDLQPKTIMEKGHLQNHLKICIKNRINPITAIQMATINPAICYNMQDKGAIAPGKKADIVLVDDLNDFNVNSVYISGKLVAKDNKYLKETKIYPIDSVKGSFKLPKVTKEKLQLKLENETSTAIEIIPGGVVTKKAKVKVKKDSENNFIYDENIDVCKIVVAERHKNTGNVAVGLLKNYGIKKGAVAVSIAHDSHNIIAVGVSDEEILFAINSLIDQDGGMVLVKDQKVIDSLPMPIGGIMSDKDPQFVNEKLTSLHEKAHEILKINPEIEPMMTLTFMSLPVIPEIKITDLGVFDVTEFKIIKP